MTRRHEGELDMRDPVTRRDALKRLAVLSAAAVVPSWVAACSKSGPTCTDVTGLSPEEASMRTQTAAYSEQATDPTKKCNACALYKAGAPGACGSCSAVKGPINPEGSCKLFVAKAT
jgi:hypothetical protein